MKIEKGTRVRVKVMLKVKDGDVLEKNIVEYFQGAGTMLPGIEEVLEGTEKGAIKKGTLDASKAFGDPKFEGSKTISRKEFPEDAEFEVGAKFVAKGPDGTDIVLEVKEVDDESIHCVMKHALADKDLEYELEVLQVTDPTPPPLPAQAIAEADVDDADA